MISTTCWLPGTHLVVGVDSGRIGRLPEDEQRRLVAEPDDEAAGRVGPRRQVLDGGRVAVAALEDRVQLQPERGARRQFAQRERRRVLRQHQRPHAVVHSFVHRNKKPIRITR